MAALAVLVAPARALDHHNPVPPWQEIEILDPNADPLGRPAVELKDVPGRECKEVDIPPTVIVHRFYYTGNRSFQGPMLPGGPSVVVVNHPRTGERCYVPVQMLPGAPKVHYTDHGIEYDYGAHGVILSFGLFGKPKVTYRNHVPATRQVGAAVAGVAHGTGKAIHATRLDEGAARVGEGVKNAACRVGTGVCDAGRQAAAPAVAVARATPLGSLFQSDPAAQAQRQRDRAVRSAEAKNLKAEADIPTNR
jgi:hypothetical protein